jgi:hypothetical protein
VRRKRRCCSILVHIEESDNSERTRGGILQPFSPTQTQILD